MTADQDWGATHSKTLDTALPFQGKRDTPVPWELAKGYGKIAETIIDRAQREGRFVHASPQLIELLTKLDLDLHIPLALYDAVAELLVWIYCMEVEHESDAGTFQVSRSHAQETKPGETPD